MSQFLMSQFPMSSVTLADIEVNYRQSGAGPAVVLLHGLAEDHRSWDGVLEKLDGFTVFAIDIRGHGGSTLGDGVGTLAQLSADLNRFLSEISGPAAVVGFSLGGTVALHAAAQRQSPVRHLVVVAASSIVGRSASEFFAGRIAQIETGRWDEFACGLRADTARQILTEVDLDAVTQTRLAAVGDGRGYVNAATAMIGIRAAPLTALLDQISVRVDVIGADGDVFCPRKAADLIVDGVADGHYHEIAGSGHLLSIDQPSRYAQSIARLLKERPT